MKIMFSEGDNCLVAAFFFADHSTTPLDFVVVSFCVAVVVVVFFVVLLVVVVFTVVVFVVVVLSLVVVFVVGFICVVIVSIDDDDSVVFVSLASFLQRSAPTSRPEL